MKHERSITELVAAGFTYVPWQAKSTYFVDRDNMVFAAVAAPPQKGNFIAAADRLFDHISTLSLRLPVPKLHRRGNFPALNFGVHHGQGLKEPFNISLTDDASDVVEEVLQDADFQRLSTFQSGEGLMQLPLHVSESATSCVSGLVPRSLCTLQGDDGPGED